MLRVLVVDDDELIRFSLKLALQRQAGIELVGMATNGQEAVEMTQQHVPDVVILDIQMPIMDGLSASLRIKTSQPDVQILAYSSFEHPQTEVMLQAARVDAFCKKEIAIQDLVRVVEALGERASQPNATEL